MRDRDVEFRCECGECEACCNDWEFEMNSWYDELAEPSEREIEIAEFNYECMVYNEPERRIAR